MDDKNNNKNTNVPMDEVLSLLQSFTETDFDISDFSIPPEKWSNEKILFCIHSVIDRFELRSTKPQRNFNFLKHLKIASNLKSIGITSISLTHSFSPTYLGYTQEFFSWKFEISKTSKINIEDKMDEKIREKIKAFKNRETDNLGPVLAEDFEYIPVRIISLYEQPEHIVGIFKELYMGLKKVNTNSDKTFTDRDILDVVINIVPFVIFDLENLSVNRKATYVNNETFSGVNGSDTSYNTMIKVNSLYKKPSVRFLTTDEEVELSTLISEIEEMN